MKSFLITLILGFFVISCGGGSSGDGGVAGTSEDCKGSDALGRWQSRTPGYNDILTFNANCSGTSTRCQSSFTFPPTLSSSVPVNVLSSNGNSGCPPVGQVTCNVFINENNMDDTKEMLINCGQGNQMYDWLGL